MPDRQVGIGQTIPTWHGPGSQEVNGPDQNAEIYMPRASVAKDCVCYQMQMSAKLEQNEIQRRVRSESAAIPSE